MFHGFFFFFFFALRLIELGKLQIKTNHRDKREYVLNPAIRKVKNKSGVIETRVFTCPECSEEYCNGQTCMDFNYDLYTRVPIKELPSNKVIGSNIKISEAVHDGKKSGGKKKLKSNDADRQRKMEKRNRSKSPSKRQSIKNKK